MGRLLRTSAFRTLVTIAVVLAAPWIQHVPAWVHVAGLIFVMVLPETWVGLREPARGAP